MDSHFFDPHLFQSLMFPQYQEGPPFSPLNKTFFFVSFPSDLRFLVSLVFFFPDPIQMERVYDARHGTFPLFLKVTPFHHCLSAMLGFYRKLISCKCSFMIKFPYVSFFFLQRHPNPCLECFFSSRVLFSHLMGQFFLRGDFP